jgi:phosphoribosylanthranilate isomerase
VLLSQREWKNQSIRDVIDLTRKAGARSSLIPLFRDLQTLYRVLDYYRPDYIHFCDNLTDGKGLPKEAEKFIQIQLDLKERHPDILIIRSIPVPLNGVSVDFPSLQLARQLEPFSDTFLIDSWVGNEPVKGFIGITGKEVQREMAKAVVQQSSIPVILAGGLSPENVYEAVCQVMPWGADSCTLTNETDNQGMPIRFKKDFTKVNRFVEAVRESEKDLKTHKKELETELKKLQAQHKQREDQLPAHTIRPHQLLDIEALETEIAKKVEKLKGYKFL